jgi:hypothetical protein
MQDIADNKFCDAGANSVPVQCPVIHQSARKDSIPQLDDWHMVCTTLRQVVG